MYRLRTEVWNASELEAMTLAISARPMVEVTLSRYSVGVSSPMRLATCLSSFLGEAEPILGRGEGPGLSEPSSQPLGVMSEATDPLDRGGSGKRLSGEGEAGLEEPMSPFETRWSILGRRRGGVAESGKRDGEGGANALVPVETVDALGRFRVVPRSR